MKPTWKLAVLTALLVGVAPVLYAESVSGDHTLTFDGDVSLWDLSGTYNEDLSDFNLSYSISMDPTGKFIGEGSAVYEDDLMDAYLSSSYSFNGKASSAAGVVRVGMTLKMTGSGYVQGYFCTFTAVARENLELDSASRQLVGSASGRVAVAVPELRRRAGAPIPRTEVVTALPYDVVGNWDLALNVAPNQNKYAGVATVSLPNGKSFPFTAKGTYSPRTDLSKLILQGQDPYRSVKFNLTGCCTNAQLVLKSLSGKMLGQSLRLPSAR
jgi:hypothetical protein